MPLAPASRPEPGLARRVRPAVDRRRRRLAKYLRLLPDKGTNRGGHAVFIVGCQRSGTEMLADAFERSRSTWVYQEYERRAFDNFRLRDAATVRRLVDRSPAAVTVLKPICDSHLVDRLLAEHRAARAVWIYRHHADVARSAVAKWGSHQADVVTAIADGRGSEVGWRAERLSAETIAMLQNLDPANSSDRTHAGALLFWAMRNRFFFELGLEGDDRIKLVSYDRLVADPAAVLPEVFEAAGCGWDASTFAEIEPRPRSATPIAGIASDIVRTCDELLGRLDSAPR